MAIKLSPKRKSPKTKGFKKGLHIPDHVKIVDGKPILSDELTAVIAKITDRISALKAKIAAVPGVLEECMAIVEESRSLFESMPGMGEIPKDIFSIEITPEVVRVAANQIGETLREAGREEIRQKYAMEELAGVAKEWESMSIGSPAVPFPPGFAGTPVGNPDFEEA